jgi:hypothetical protein
MKEITIKIPEKKLSFFMELVRNLGFEVKKEVEIPEEHKDIVKKRIKKSNDDPSQILNWEDVKDNFKLD